MSRRRLLWRNGTWLEIPADYVPPPRKGPYVISDTQDAFKSMADGKMYDSKSAYRRSLRERGMVEMGNDLPAHKEYEPTNIGQDIKDAIAQVEAGKSKPAVDNSALQATIANGKTTI